MQNSISFEKPVLFLEFFVRDYVFHGKGIIRTELPPDAFFYSGKSKAINRSNPPSSMIAFGDNIPFLSKNISEDLKNKIFKENTNIVASIGGESVDKQNIWHLDEPRIISNKFGLNGNNGQMPYHNFASISPYRFNVLDIDEQENVITNFPREEVTLKIKKGQTLCFLCHRMARGDGEWYTPNVNLVLFVKNYGLFDKIDIVPQIDADRIAMNNMLCDGKFDIRNFRKSGLNFELG